MTDNLLDLFREVIVEDKESIKEFIKVEIKPVADYLKSRRKKELEKEYEEVLKLEGEI
jgi:hypothetical protein